MQLSLIVLGLVILLGATHALEPDHVVAMRMMKGAKDYMVFGVTHGVGFALIAVPLILLFSYFQFYGILAGDVIAIGFALLLLYGEITGKELEVSPKGSGVLQGAFAITPSKVMVAILAAEASLIVGMIYVASFIIVSSVSMLVVGLMFSFVPEKIEKVINIIIALVTISYVVYNMIQLGIAQ